MTQQTVPEPLRLEQIDKNFKNQSSAENLVWIDAFDARLAIRGLGWLKEAREARSFRRCPDRAAALLSPALQTLTRCPAGVFIAFFTDAADLSVRLFNQGLPTMQHMAPTGTSGAELYFRDGSRWFPIGVAVPPADNPNFERPLAKDLPREWREYRLYLPLYKGVDEVMLGFSPGAKVEPSPAPEGTRPLFFYGTSITQGGCANTAGSDFVSTLGRMLDAETINFGFSGSGKGEPEVAELIREIDAEIFVLDYAANCDPDRLRETLPGFVRILRERHPRTPIVLMSCVAYNHTLTDAVVRDRLDQKRDEMMRFYIRTKEAGDANLHFIDGNGILPPGMSGTYVDNVHPTSAGFAVMAERLAPHFTSIRLWNRRAQNGV